MKELLTELRNKVLYLRNTDELSAKGELILLHKLNALEKQFAICGVGATLPSINSNTFRNYLEANGYAETINPLIYKKGGFEYDKEILHRHFINEIEFGN